MLLTIVVHSMHAISHPFSHSLKPARDSVRYTVGNGMKSTIKVRTKAIARDNGSTQMVNKDIMEFKKYLSNSDIPKTDLVTIYKYFDFRKYTTIDNFKSDVANDSDYQEMFQRLKEIKQITIHILTNLVDSGTFDTSFIHFAIINLLDDYETIQRHEFLELLRSYLRIDDRINILQYFQKHGFYMDIELDKHVHLHKLGRFAFQYIIGYVKASQGSLQIIELLESYLDQFPIEIQWERCSKRDYINIKRYESLYKGIVSIRYPATQLKVKLTQECIKVLNRIVNKYPIEKQIKHIFNKDPSLLLTEQLIKLSDDLE